MNVRFSAAERAEVWDRYERGEYIRPIARAIGRSHAGVRELIAKHGGVRPVVPTECSDARLSLAEREESPEASPQATRLVRSPWGWVGRPRPSPGRSLQTADEATTGPVRPRARRDFGPEGPRWPSWLAVLVCGGWWTGS